MLQIKESYVNQTKGYRYGDSGWYETWTDNTAKLFRTLQQEFGRCMGKIYRDGLLLPNGEHKPVGWVFEKRMKYDDARGHDPEKDFYIREVWVEVREVAPQEN